MSQEFLAGVHKLELFSRRLSLIIVPHRVIDQRKLWRFTFQASMYRWYMT